MTRAEVAEHLLRVHQQVQSDGATAHEAMQVALHVLAKDIRAAWSCDCDKSYTRWEANPCGHAATCPEYGAGAGPS